MNDNSGQVTDIAVWRKRLRYRAWHRGIREMDLILGGYADSYAEQWTAADLGRYEALLEENDIDLLSWITGQRATPEDADGALIAAVAQFQRDNAGK